MASKTVKHKAPPKIAGIYFLLSWFLTKITWLHPNSIFGRTNIFFPSFLWRDCVSFKRWKIKSMLLCCEAETKYGLGPINWLFSFFKWSILLGKINSNKETIEFPRFRIFWWDRKLIYHKLKTLKNIKKTIPYRELSYCWLF